MNKYLNMFGVLRAPAGDGSEGGGEGGGDESFYPVGGAAATAVETPAAGSTKPQGEVEAGETGGETGGEGGEAGETPESTLTEAEKELLAEGKPAEGAAKPAVTPAAPGAIKLDAESIGQLASALKPQSAAAAVSPSMSAEEVQRVLNPVQVTADTLRGLGFTEPTEEQVAGFQNFANATVKNAVSIARVLIQQEAKKFEEFISPISSHIQQQQVEGARTEFFASYPSLQKYNNIVKIAASSIQPTNADGSQKTKQQIYKEVASATVRELRSLNIQIGQPAASANHSAGAGGAVGKPNAFPGSGRSGSSGPAGGKNNPDADIYAR